MVAFAGLFGLAWVAEHLIEVVAVSGACGVLAVAAVVWLARCQERREAAFAAARGIRSRADGVLPVRGTPQVTQGTKPLAVEQHVHYHVHLAAGQGQVTPVIRGRVLPGDADGR